MWADQYDQLNVKPTYEFARVYAGSSTTVGGYGPALDNITIVETLANRRQCKNAGWQTMVDKYSTPFRN